MTCSQSASTVIISHHLRLRKVTSVKPLLDILGMKTIAHYMCSIGSSGNSPST